MFCPKCGSILRPETKNGKKIMSCTCGYNDSNINQFKISETIKDNSDIEVVDKEVEVHPKTKTDCSKCGHNIAYYWTIQTRAGDEAETEFYKCEKCKHTWRENH